MPSRLTLSLASAHLPTSDLRESVHAAIYDALRRADPELAAWAHEAPFAPFALDWPLVPGTLAVECTDAVAAALLAVWVPGARLLERADATLRAEVHSVEHQVWTFDDMLQRHRHRKAGDMARLNFKTPTAFRSKELVIAWPDPHLLVVGTLRRWGACFPQPPHDLTGHSLRVVQMDIHDAPIKLRRGGRVRHSAGFVGTATVQFDSSAPSLAALLEFASRMGSGILIAYGFGRLVVQFD